MVTGICSISLRRIPTVTDPFEGAQLLVRLSGYARFGTALASEGVPLVWL